MKNRPETDESPDGASGSPWEETVPEADRKPWSEPRAETRGRKAAKAGAGESEQAETIVPTTCRMRRNKNPSSPSRLRRRAM